jgi:hypothetical protein
VYGIVSPAAPYPVEVVDLVRLRLDVVPLAATVRTATAELTEACGPLAEAVALFVTEPESTSAWVTVYVAVHVSLVPLAKVVEGQLTGTRVSLTDTPVRAVAPEFVTR